MNESFKMPEEESAPDKKPKEVLARIKQAIGPTLAAGAVIAGTAFTEANVTEAMAADKQPAKNVQKVEAKKAAEAGAEQTPPALQEFGMAVKKAHDLLPSIHTPERAAKLSAYLDQSVKIWNLSPGERAGYTGPHNDVSLELLGGVESMQLHLEKTFTVPFTPEKRATLDAAKREILKGQLNAIAADLEGGTGKTNTPPKPNAPKKEFALPFILKKETGGTHRPAQAERKKGASYSRIVPKPPR